MSKVTFSEDKELVERVTQALRDNGGYCPCSIIKNEDTKCMCKEFREMEEGICHCGLYKKSR